MFSLSFINIDNENRREKMELKWINSPCYTDNEREMGKSHVSLQCFFLRIWSSGNEEISKYEPDFGFLKLSFCCFRGAKTAKDLSISHCCSFAEHFQILNQQIYLSFGFRRYSIRLCKDGIWFSHNLEGLQVFFL